MIKAWALPLIVAALTVPIAVGFMLGGPGPGLALGALAAATLLVVAIRMYPRERIEVAGAPDQRHRVLVVAMTAIDEPSTASEVAAAAGPASDVLVLAPALNRPLARWADDLGDAREEAQRRLVLSIGTLAAAELEARGRVGDSDAVQAVEDTLREFSADEALLVAAPVEEKGAEARTLASLRSRLDMPLRLIEV